MAVRFEALVPLLDHRVVELSWRLPTSLKVHDGRGKRLLCRTLDKYVRATPINRPKQGFAVPVGDWIRGPLQGWAETLLSEQRLRQDGYFNPQPICGYWREHLSGQMNRRHQLWAPLMFQAWLDNLRSNS